MPLVVIFLMKLSKKFFLLRSISILEAPVKGWTQGGESETLGLRTPTVLPCTSTVLPCTSTVLPCTSLYSPVLHCTSTALPLYSHCTPGVRESHLFPLVGL